MSQTGQVQSVPYKIRGRLHRNITGRIRQLIHLPGTLMTQYHRFFLSLILVISPYLISGAPTSASISLPKDDVLSTYHCTDYPAWNGPSFNPRHCVTAASQFYLEVFEHRDMLFEFRVIGGRAQSRYPSQRTPQRFTFGESPYEFVKHLAEKWRSAFAAMHCSRWLIWSNLGQRHARWQSSCLPLSTPKNSQVFHRQESSLRRMWLRTMMRGMQSSK